MLASTLLTSTSALAFRTAEDSVELAEAGRVAFAGQVVFSLDTGRLPDGVELNDAEAVIESALAVWSAPNCGGLSVSYAGVQEDEIGPGDGLNSITWLGDWKATGRPIDATAATDVQYTNSGSGWVIAEADIYLNAQYLDWSATGAEGTVSLAAVLTHELGHAFGLLHPCEENGADGPLCSDLPKASKSVMYPLYDASGGLELSADDEAGICFLYPTGCDACLEGEACVDDVCVAECGGEVCSDDEQCGAWGCVPQGGCLEEDCGGAACDDDQDCGLLSRCLEGTCLSGERALGEACSASADCQKAVCVEDLCQPRCEEAGACGSIDGLEGSVGECRPAVEEPLLGCVGSGQYPFGATCQMGEDCATGLCVTFKGKQQCTATCESSSDCVGDWTCDEIDDRSVCVPPAIYAEGGGCASAPPTPARRPAGVPLMALAFLCGVFAVRHLQNRSSVKKWS